MTDSFTWLPRLDERLGAIASEVPACKLAADIGADHGKLACWLLASERADRMVVSDISKQSRDKARDLFMRYDVLDRAEIRSENGLYALRDREPDAVIIAGMGGGLIREILDQPVDLKGARLILSAHTELPLVRDALLRRRYSIIKELLLKASGRYYRVISAVPGEQKLSESERELGFNLRGTSSARVKDYLLWQMKVSETWQGERGETYRKLLMEALDEQTDS